MGHHHRMWAQRGELSCAAREVGGKIDTGAVDQPRRPTSHSIKMAMRWTGASERTVKYWRAGERGPSDDHLIALARHSDAVLFVLLTLAGRHVVED